MGAGAPSSSPRFVPVDITLTATTSLSAMIDSTSIRMSGN